MTLRAPATTRSRDREFRSTMIVGDETIEVDVKTKAIPDGDNQFITVHFDKEMLEKLETNGNLSFPVAPGEHVQLDLGKLDAALGALTRCSDDLVRSWGIPVAELDAVSVKPQSIGKIDLAPRSYPSELRGKNWEAQTTALFEINAQGKVAECRIVSYSGPKQLLDSACAKPFRMRFKPARNNAGEHVRSWLVVRVNSAPL